MAAPAALPPPALQTVSVPEPPCVAPPPHALTVADTPALAPRAAISNSAGALDDLLSRCETPLARLVDALSIRWKRDVWLRHFEGMPSCASDLQAAFKGPVLLRLLRNAPETDQPDSMWPAVEVTLVTAGHGHSARILLDCPPVEEAAGWPHHPFLYAALAAADRFVRGGDEHCDFATAIPALKSVLAGIVRRNGQPPRRRPRAPVATVAPAAAVAAAAVAAMQPDGNTSVPRQKRARRAGALYSVANTRTKGIFEADFPVILDSTLQRLRDLMRAPPPGATALATYKARRSLAECFIAGGLLSDAGWTLFKGIVFRYVPGVDQLELWTEQIELMTRYQNLPADLKSGQMLSQFFGSHRFRSDRFAEYLTVQGVLTPAARATLQALMNWVVAAMDDVIPPSEALLLQQADLVCGSRTASGADDRGDSLSLAQTQIEQAAEEASQRGSLSDGQKLLAGLREKKRMIARFITLAFKVEEFAPAVVASFASVASMASMASMANTAEPAPLIVVAAAQMAARSAAVSPGATGASAAVTAVGSTTGLVACDRLVHVERQPVMAGAVGSDPGLAGRTTGRVGQPLTTAWGVAEIMARDDRTMIADRWPTPQGSPSSAWATLRPSSTGSANAATEFTDAGMFIPDVPGLDDPFDWIARNAHDPGMEFSWPDGALVSKRTRFR